MTLVFTVDECWNEGWLGRTTLLAGPDGFRLATDADPAPSGHLRGTLLPGFHDAHVHLGLIDGAALLAGGISSADDFGWGLEIAKTWADDPSIPTTRFAGQLLTAPGGYPTGSGWAPPDACAPVASAEDAGAAVDCQLDAGAGFIKIALNSQDGPVFDDATLSAVVGHAHERGVVVAAHTQGAGQAERAFSSGVDRLAHAPWSERLDDDLIAAMARSQVWVSTLDIHGWGSFGRNFTVANDNVRRFNAAGGAVVYGTDLGNGPLPVGINERELLALEHAALGLDALVAAIVGPAFGTRMSHIPEERSDDPAQWLASAKLIRATDVNEHLT